MTGSGRLNCLEKEVTLWRVDICIFTFFLLLLAKYLPLLSPFAASNQAAILKISHNTFGFGEYQLWYLRNKEKQEVDFLVTENAQPLFMVEAKFFDVAVSSNLIKFQKALHVPAIQLVHQQNVARKIKNETNVIIVASAADWLAGLN